MTLIILVGALLAFHWPETVIISMQDAGATAPELILDVRICTGG